MWTSTIERCCSVLRRTKSHTKWVALGVAALGAVLAGFFFYREHANRVELEQTIAMEKSEQVERERVAKEEAAREAASQRPSRRRASRTAESRAGTSTARRKGKSVQQPAEGAAQPGVYPAR